jgi:UDP-N-acetylglucosamine diphosphorylase/glucosamine-1-phosphate N-acetyltransferase
MLENTCAVVLAAGNGKRMMSKLPKVLCEVSAKPMLGWVLSAVNTAQISDICVVVGAGKEMVESYLGGGYAVAEQTEQLGTGHAVKCAADFLGKVGERDVLVLCGDAPFISAEVIAASLAKHRSAGSECTVVTAKLCDGGSYGRIIRGENGIKIVEAKDATAEQLAITEVNSGAYWFKNEALAQALKRLSNNNVSGEYYLTDTVGMLRSAAFVSDDSDIILGANNRVDLLKLNQIAKEKTLEKLLCAGVDIPLADGIIISTDAVVGQGTKILPGTIITGNTVIGEDCTIGPNSVIGNSTIGNGTIINASQCYDSKIGSSVRLGPFSHIRPNCVVADSVKIGDFVELKNSEIGEKTSIAHLTYIGDSTVGQRINFGCGVVTANYDGVNKPRCVIEDDVFIGCNVNLVAPVKIGKGATLAAGSTITDDVPAGALGIARSRQTVKEGYKK